VSDESLFREVDEEVRQDQLKKIWARYGNLIVAVCLALVAVVAGIKGWQYWQIRQSEQAAEISKVFDVRKSKPDPEAGSLSGGNLQKFVVGREMLREPKVLVVNQPTWGVDAGAAALIRQALIDLSRRGAAVIVISQDLDEIFEVADRIAVIHDGRLSVPEPVAAMSLEKIGLLMGGSGHAH